MGNRPGLGRNINHDPRSRAFVALTSPVLKTIRHTRLSPIFNQGSLGSCTGNAMAGGLGTTPHTIGKAFNQDTAVKIYSRATQIDPFEGAYPPVDTGSDGLSVCKAAKEMGYVNTYAWAFGLDHALGALMLGPVLTGFNWYSDMDNPNSAGIARVGGEIIGGHEVVAVGVDIEKMLVWFANSWGKGWGLNGYFALTWEDWRRLLNEQGDVTQFTSVASAGTFRYRQKDAEAMLRKVGMTGEDVKIGAAVGVAESLLQPDIEVVDTNGRLSVGLFQINLTDGDKPGTGREGYTREQLKDGLTNTKVAYILWKSRQWRPWGAYTNGSYKKYMYPGELKKGMKNDAVRVFQSRLNRRGETDKVIVDGDFGPKTQAATSKFQKYHGMAGSGIVGPLTWGLL